MSKIGIKTGQMAHRAGVSKETLRFYERNELLREPARTPAGYRVYNESDILRVRFIKNAQSLGFSLTEVRELLAIADGDVVECLEVRAIAEKKLQFIQNQIDSLKRLEGVLADLIKRCSKAATIKGCPIIESISKGESV